MTVTVDPAQLDGYAAQLERNATYFVAPLRAYCEANCSHTDAMTGVLALARPAVGAARDISSSLFGAGERNLTQVAANLRVAASYYREQDEAAAERIWQVLPRVHAPNGYGSSSDERHRGDFRDPFAPEVAVPAKQDTIRGMIHEARQDVGLIDTWLSRYGLPTLSEKIIPLISGDWDTLRQNARGYEALAGNFGAAVIQSNLRYGLDSLSASWSSPAALQFDFTIRARWLPAIDTLRHVLDVHHQSFEAMARCAQFAFETLLVWIDLLKHWVIEKSLRLLRLAASALHATEFVKELIDFAAHVLKVWHEIKLLLQWLESTIELVHQDILAAGAEAKAIDEMWLTSGENRLDPITMG